MILSKSRRGRRKRPQDRKIPIKPGPPEEMLYDDALERFIDEWIVFKITKPDDWGFNEAGIVVAHGGPQKPMHEISKKVHEAEPGARTVVMYATGRRLRTREEVLRHIEEYFDTHDYDEWLHDYR